MKSATPSTAPSGPEAKTTWTFLSNHAHVLIYLSEHEDALLRESPSGRCR